jgi:hypothetical protein
VIKCPIQSMEPPNRDSDGAAIPINIST